MNIHAATSSYESWLASFFPLHAPDLAFKHQQMADPADQFPFFRATYYRWTQLWPKLCPELEAGPKVLAVGDLHVDNFGTWRDSEGRLVWGINDFDEATELSYANDLVRLAASARLARRGGTLKMKFPDACAAILHGYRANLQAGGSPFVLEENHPQLRSLAMAEERDPVRFWKKMTALLDDPPAAAPESVRPILTKSLPGGCAKCELRFRPQVGKGSLGRPRYVALAQWHGGWVAREAKAMAPSAQVWHTGTGKLPFSRMAEIVAGAVRCPDPCYQLEDCWIVRRLAPRCSRIELRLANVSDECRLLEAMGAETANIHLGTPNATAAILHDLNSRAADWLEVAAKLVSRTLELDWEEWRKKPAAS